MRLIDLLAYDKGNIRFDININDSRIESLYTKYLKDKESEGRYYPTAIEVFEFFHGLCNYSLLKDVYISSIYIGQMKDNNGTTIVPICELEIIEDFNDYEIYPEYQIKVIRDGLFNVIVDAHSYKMDVIHFKRVMHHFTEFLRDLWEHEYKEENYEGTRDIIHLINAYYKLVEYFEDHGYVIPSIYHATEFKNDPYNWILEYDIIKNCNPGSCNKMRLHEFFFILANARFDNIHYGSHKQPDRISSSQRIRDCVKDYVDGQFDFPTILNGYKQDLACIELDGNSINIAIDCEANRGDLYYGIIKDNRFKEQNGSLVENKSYRCHGFNVYDEDAIDKINSIYKYFKSVNPDIDLAIGGFSNESEGITMQYLHHDGYVYLIVLQTKRLSIVIYNQTADCIDTEE